MENQTHNRFWEFYLVRYLAGTLFAVLVVFVLGANYSNNINKALSFNLAGENNISLSVENIYNGLFKSSEVVNRTRVHPFDRWNQPYTNPSIEYEKVTESLSFEAVLILLLFGFLYMYLSSMPIYFFHIVRFILYPVLVGKIKWVGAYEFYRRSNKARKKHSKTDYISSYKHLREHGNAFGIILMEVLFAYFLVIFDFSILFIIAWLIVGFFGWFLGHYLEFKMMENSKLEN